MTSFLQIPVLLMVIKEIDCVVTYPMSLRPDARLVNKIECLLSQFSTLPSMSCKDFSCTLAES
jgi:hypothetical protein